jgi:hypothetical protein
MTAACADSNTRHDSTLWMQHEYVPADEHAAAAVETDMGATYAMWKVLN